MPFRFTYSTELARQAVCRARSSWSPVAFDLLIVLALVATVRCGNLCAQSLSDTLTAEPPERLATDARDRGDIVRGAILFHQGNINCIACHRATAANEKIGPALNRIGQEATDRYIIESILQPSMQIKKGYETTRVLLHDANVVVGTVIEESASSIRIRTQDVSQPPVEIRRADIEAMEASEQSIMPNGLVDQLKDRQQFLDLLRYVLDLKNRTGPAQAGAMGAVPTRELAKNLLGRILINELNCSACHDMALPELPFPPTSAPDLKWAATNLNTDYLAKFIAAPSDMKPGTAMPHVLDALEEERRAEVAESIVHFLVAESSRAVANRDVRQEQMDTRFAAVAEGEEIFHTVGCVACHAPRDDDSTELSIPGSVSLGELGRKYDSEALVAFLENPHLARPSGRMPNMQLSHREAINLASYLLQQGEAQTKEILPDDSKATAGRQYFINYRCNSCHSSILEAADTTRISLGRSNLADSRGCTSGSTGPWPGYALTTEQLEQLQAALITPARELTSDEKIDTTLVAFKCTACHSRDGLGGVDPARSPHFQTTNLNLGEQGRLPPTLTGVGAKLKPTWLRDVLVKGRSIRPYMKTRMPQFGDKNVGHLGELFDSVDALPPVDKVNFDDQKAIRDLGLMIVGNQGLNCVACHTYQYKIADTMPAVDLTEMAARLKKDWFCHYMLNPQRFSPNTVMPSFWPGGTAMRNDIESKTPYQVEAIWQYLLDGRQARAPRGVIREPLEIVVTSEARMLRRRYPGMSSKRGIGIGYPGGVNLSFDAEQMRLTSLWRGRFVDPSGVWYGQGHGMVRPLGKVLQLDHGPDLYFGSTPEAGDASRRPDYQFNGYDFDQQRRPTLRYTFRSVRVSDYFKEFKDGETKAVQLRRRVSFTAGNETHDLEFCIASGDVLEELQPGAYRVDDSLIVRIAGEHSTRIVSANQEQRLVVPLSLLPAKRLTLVVEYVW